MLDEVELVLDPVPLLVTGLLVQGLAGLLELVDRASSGPLGLGHPHVPLEVGLIDLILVAGMEEGPDLLVLDRLFEGLGVVLGQGKSPLGQLGEGWLEKPPCGGERGFQIPGDPFVRSSQPRVGELGAATPADCWRRKLGDLALAFWSARTAFALGRLGG